MLMSHRCIDAGAFFLGWLNKRGEENGYHHVWKCFCLWNQSSPCVCNYLLALIQSFFITFFLKEKKKPKHTRRMIRPRHVILLTDLVVDGLCAWGRSQRLGDSSSGVESHGLSRLALGPETLGEHRLLIVEILQKHTERPAQRCSGGSTTIQSLNINVIPKHPWTKRVSQRLQELINHVAK